MYSKEDLQVIANVLSQSTIKGEGAHFMAQLLDKTRAAFEELERKESAAKVAAIIDEHVEAGNRETSEGRT